MWQCTYFGKLCNILEIAVLFKVFEKFIVIEGLVQDQCHNCLHIVLHYENFISLSNKIWELKAITFDVTTNDIHFAIDPSVWDAGVILCMHPANERRCWIVTSSLIGGTHTQKDPWDMLLHNGVRNQNHVACLILIVMNTDLSGLVCPCMGTCSQ